MILMVLLKYKNLELIGTSHIAIESVNFVGERIEKISPKIVAIELDHQRFRGLFSKGDDKVSFSSIKQVGITGFIFLLIAKWAEEKLGKMVHTKPGDEMRAAVKAAAKKDCKLALIDQDIQKTLQNLSKSITLKEKLTFVGEIVKALFFPRRELKKFGITSLDLQKVPEEKVINHLMAMMKKSYPNVYYALIGQRNEFMAKQLLRIMKSTDEKIIAVVGAGHAEGLIKLLKERWNKVDFV